MDNVEGSSRLDSPWRDLIQESCLPLGQGDASRKRLELNPPLKAGARRGGHLKRAAGKHIPPDKEWKSVCVCGGVVAKGKTKNHQSIPWEKVFSNEEKVKRPPNRPHSIPPFISHSVCPDLEEPKAWSGGIGTRRAETKGHMPLPCSRFSRQGQPWAEGSVEALYWMMGDGSFDLDQTELFNNWKWDSKAVIDGWYNPEMQKKDLTEQVWKKWWERNKSVYWFITYLFLYI